MSEETKRSPTYAPGYVLHRYVTEANDSLPESVERHGINMQGYERANIQVVPDTGNPDPSIKVLFWSAQKAEFVEDHVGYSFAGKGAGVAYEVTVDCNGRNMFVAVVGGMSAGKVCRILVGGFKDLRK